jgi:hypothetical protein
MITNDCNYIVIRSLHIFLIELFPSHVWHCRTWRDTCLGTVALPLWPYRICKVVYILLKFAYIYFELKYEQKWSKGSLVLVPPLIMYKAKTEKGNLFLLLIYPSCTQIKLKHYALLGKCQWQVHSGSLYQPFTRAVLRLAIKHQCRSEVLLHVILGCAHKTM